MGRTEYVGYCSLFCKIGQSGLDSISIFWIVKFQGFVSISATTREASTEFYRPRRHQQRTKLVELDDSELDVDVIEE